MSPAVSAATHNQGSTSTQQPQQSKHVYAIESILSVDPSIQFNFEPYITQTLGILLVKPPIKPICTHFIRGACRQGSSCPFQHPQKMRAVVCKHWLRGLCKKGEVCEFLHEYNMKRMPECWFFAKLGECTNPECQYLHIDPDSKIQVCRVLLYTNSCPSFLSAKHELPVLLAEDGPQPGTAGAPRMSSYKNVTPKFGSDGIDSSRFENNNTNRDHQRNDHRNHFNRDGADAPYGDGQRAFRTLDQVTCFKCSETGHYANSCPKRRKFDDQAEYN
ncbi:hypothetical protein BDEG_24730 [Batrachochytrium dendrobatidis JEL423]|uniref:mRNA 3'-end-processing protein n=1 Tax=Batrachochytrium dendrobatidis (strain JEL423) TaxID=403673 RepID=A0A177WN42_BATDL|nr:hypothetical protein BDEG_24730 [Batrachochytrium dendrobatidis JEL423]